MSAANGNGSSAAMAVMSPKGLRAAPSMPNGKPRPLRSSSSSSAVPHPWLALGVRERGACACGQAAGACCGLWCHASRPSPASRACAMGCGCGPLGRHDSAEFKRLGQGLDRLGGRPGAALEIDAVLAGQPGEGDPEPAELGGCQIERGGGLGHASKVLADNGDSAKSHLSRWEFSQFPFLRWLSPFSCELQRPSSANSYQLLFSTCAVTRRRFSSGCKPHPATAPAGSDRSRHGGDEMSEAFG